MPTYYRISYNAAGPQRTSGPDWDVCCERVDGYRAWVDSGPGWNRSIVVDRRTRKHYVRTEAARTHVREIDRETARAMYRQAGRPRLIPVLPWAGRHVPALTGASA